MMPKTPTKKTAASTAVNQPYIHDANGDLVTQETRGGSRHGMEAPQIAIRHVEAGWYVVKKGRGFVLDKAGAMKFFTTTAAAMRAADNPATVFGWAGMGYGAPLVPNVIEDAEDQEDCA
jgi:hypothetical protein